MTDTPNNRENNSIREGVIFFLMFLTNEKVQQVFHRYKAPEKLAYEMLQTWFEEIYVPSERYLDSLKGDLSKENVETFEDNFDVEELVSMERFHRCLELRYDMLPDKYKAAQSMPLNTAWKNIVKDGWYLLEELEPDIAKRREILEFKLMDTLGYKKPLAENEWRYLLYPDKD